MKSQIFHLFLLIIITCSFSCTQYRQQETKLIFGRLIGDSGYVSETDWNKFVDDVIIKQFPLGFTTYDADGYYLINGNRIHEPTKVFLLLHDSAKTNEAKFQIIINEYIKRFNQQSVIKENCPVNYEFEKGK